jgi:hypothetical protein
MILAISSPSYVAAATARVLLFTGLKLKDRDRARLGTGIEADAAGDASVAHVPARVIAHAVQFLGKHKYVIRAGGDAKTASLALILADLDPAAPLASGLLLRRLDCHATLRYAAHPKGLGSCPKRRARALL